MRSLKKILYKLVSDKKVDPADAMLLFKEIDNNDYYLDDDIAIIGMAARLPDADTVEEFWNNLQDNKNCISELPDQRKKDLDTLFAAEDRKNIFYRPAGYLKEIDKFDASFFRISPKEADYMEPEQRLLLEVVWETIENAGYGLEIKDSDTGVYIGHDHVAGMPYRNYTGGLANPDALALTGTYPSILSSRISFVLNLKGPNLVIDTACSSGLVALHEACLAIRNKRCGKAIVGGISLQLWPAKFNSFKMVETNSNIVRTFDRHSTGTVWGEGVCAFLLKPLSLAVKDKDNIQGIIKSIAVNNDGASSGIIAPNAEAQEEVILRAWSEAKIDPGTLSYIETHGTGTVMGDPIEVKALKNAFSRFSDKKQFCAIGSLKPSIGHLISASGTASLLKVILAFKYKQIPATINFLEPNSYIDFCNSPLYVNDRLSYWDADETPRRAGISCFGFSGTNCHLVLEEAPALKDKPEEKEESIHILTLSAKSRDILAEIVRNYSDYIKANPEVSLEDLCYTANTGRSHFEYRLALLFTTNRELRDILNHININEFSKNDSELFYYGGHEIVYQHIHNGDVEDPQDPMLLKITEAEKVQLCNDSITQFTELITDNKKKAYESLCGFYIRGADIPFKNLIYKHNKRRKITLPVYPFRRERHWYFPGTISAHNQDFNYFYETCWIPDKIEKTDAFKFNGKTLIFIDEWGLGTEIAEIIRAKNGDVCVIQIKKPDKDSLKASIKKINENDYLIDGSYESYDQLLKQISASEISGILHLSTLLKNTNIKKAGDFTKVSKNGVKSLFFLTKALISNKCKQNISLVLAADYVNEVSKDEEIIQPNNAAFFGMAKVVGQEYRNLMCTLIDIDRNTKADDILYEACKSYKKNIVAYRNGSRYLEELRRIDITAIPDNNMTIKNNGVYVITGGTGGIGLEIGKYLASKNNVNLCLVSRSSFPEREEWAAILAKGEDSKLLRILTIVEEIEAKGSCVMFYHADISVNREIKIVLESIRERYGEIHGIMHCAGIGGEGFLLKKEENQFDSVLAPKIIGTWNLDILTKNEELDFFILFSSIIAVMGSAGQSDYAAANSYLESFAHYRRKKGKRTQTISWAAWKETGMAFNSGYSETASPFKPLDTKSAINAFHTIIHKDLPRVIIGEPDYKVLHSVMDYIYINLSEDLKKGITNTVNRIGKTPSDNHAAVHVHLKGRNNGIYNPVEKQLAVMWNSVLGVKDIDINDSFMKLGGDSIIATNLLKEMEKSFGTFIDISDIFTYPTIAQMAEYIMKESDKKNTTIFTNEEIMKKLANGEITITEASELRKQLKLR